MTRNRRPDESGTEFEFSFLSDEELIKIHDSIHEIRAYRLAATKVLRDRGYDAPDPFVQDMKMKVLTNSLYSAGPCAATNYNCLRKDQNEKRPGSNLLPGMPRRLLQPRGMLQHEGMLEQTDSQDHLALHDSHQRDAIGIPQVQEDQDALLLPPPAVFLSDGEKPMSPTDIHQILQERLTFHKSLPPNEMTFAVIGELNHLLKKVIE